MKNSQVQRPFSPDHPQCFPKLFTISAPAGAGKTTLIRMLEEEFSHAFVKTTSVTTRQPRQGEIPGKDYHFVSKDVFEKLLHKEDFLEWIFLFGQYYGTSAQEIEKIWQLGKHAIAIIDVQGALAIRCKMMSVAIFIAPPSHEELARRLTARGSEEGVQRKARLEHSPEELAVAHQFDYIIINDVLDRAYAVLKSIFIAEEHRNTL
ncbi:guanylate kinase [Candidatus Chlamydia sanziniae]|uniref:Guanylate kinase n=1 Tax=Candidatus Chlamydia sanziniae TaxID=1806891 RepID=A0A1A9HVP4_9CHLA|nr:guanylate kinase [Candidatus Chlamydia sanziniae]ANH78905.1 Guanylate kinase [Candidatus Chlamydia sanziniae]